MAVIIETKMQIRYKPNVRKIIEAITFILKIKPYSRNIFILKSLYFADKFHLQEHGRPVTGDTFYKLKHGPVGTSAYDLLKLNELSFSQEILDYAQMAFMGKMKGKWPIYQALREPLKDVFSDSDENCIRKAIDYCMELSNKNPEAFYSDFSLSEESHKEVAWLDAEMGKPMDFIKMIDNTTPDRDALIKYIRQNCSNIVL